jgi:hypothetical protein
MLYGPASCCDQLMQLSHWKSPPEYLGPATHIMPLGSYRRHLPQFSIKPSVDEPFQNSAISDNHRPADEPHTSLYVAVLNCGQ